MTLSYKKVKSQRVGDAEVEYWHGFREFAKVVYRQGTTPMEFPAEWLGWGQWWGHWLSVDLTPPVEEGSARYDIDSLAAQVHLALSLMKIRNVVTVKSSSMPATTEELQAFLKLGMEWMSNHGWRVVVARSSPLFSKLRIRRRGFSLFQAAPSPEEVIAQGRWAARIFQALCQPDAKQVVLYVGERARHGNFFVSMEW